MKMKMKKAFIAAFMFGLAMFANVGNMTNLSVMADVIWEGPVENSFFARHQFECISEGRTYTTQGPDGRVAVCQEPSRESLLTYIPNGESVYVSYVYETEEGQKWGITGGLNAADPVGWIRMDSLLEQYDETVFYREFGDQIEFKSGEISKEYLDKSVYFWSFPGSKYGYLTSVWRDETPYYSQVFVDEMGYTWGYCSYYYASKGWICVDKPDANYEELYPNGGPVRELVIKEQLVQEETSIGREPNLEIHQIIDDSKEVQKSNRTVLILGIAIGIISVITAILIVVLIRKNKN